VDRIQGVRSFSLPNLEVKLARKVSWNVNSVCEVQGDLQSRVRWSYLPCYARGTSCDGDASLRNEKFSLNSRATSEGLCRMSFRCRLDGSTSRTVPDSEAMKRLPLLPNAVFAWYRKDYVVV
jgi:hypothetical protein